MYTLTLLSRGVGRNERLADRPTIGAERLDRVIVAACAAHEEGVKGSLEPGKRADLVVRKDDPCSVYPRDLQYATVDLTRIGGRI